MTEWATSGRVKVERAKEHIGNLNAEITTFRQRDPYKVSPNIDPQTGELAISVEIREYPPLRWGALAGDVVHNLRSALDILWRIVCLSPDRSENRRDGFPILSSKEFKRRFLRKKQPARQALVDLLKTIQPYEPGDEGGNDLLWKLRVVNDTDKHHLLIPVFVGLRGGLVIATPAEGAALACEITVRPYTYPIAQGAELFRVALPFAEGTQVNVKVELGLQVAFGEPQLVQGQEIVSTLHQFVGVVEGVAETFRIAGLLNLGDTPSQSAPPGPTVVSLKPRA